MSEAVQNRDPHHVVCVGDGMCARRFGATETLERICRVRDPASPWKFWHQGEVGASAASVSEEALWRALGLGAGRLLLSLGTAEIATGVDVRTAADRIRECMDLLSGKGPRELWLLLPVAALWPEEVRGACEELRAALSVPRGRWKSIDPREEVERFLEAQATHPDLSVGLVEDAEQGVVPTPTGAQLLAERIFREWKE